MITSTETAPRAHFTRNRYMGRGPADGPAPGYNVTVDGIGFVLMGLPQSWAAKAACVLNDCADAGAQMAELTRIRSALAA